MVGLRRIGVLPATLVALVLVSAAAAQAADTVDFSFYPAGARDCLYKASDSSKCKSDTVPATNSCLCRNGGNFITTAAACIGKASQGDLKTVYRTMRDACDTSNTPITVTEDDFMEAANGGTTSTSSTRSATSTRTSSRTSATSASATTTTTGTTASTTASGTTSDTTSGTATATTTAPPATSTAADEQGGQASSGLSTAAMAGIIVGAIGGVALLGGFAYFFFRRRRSNGEESHPMLPQHARSSAVPLGRESTAYYGSPPDTGTWQKKDWGPSPDLRSSVFNWESPSHLAYSNGALAASPPMPIQELDGTQRFPTGSSAAPAEMGGTPVTMTPPPPAPANAHYQAYNPAQQQQHPGYGWSQTQR
ncbi:hypothetical protein NEMBOFW57_007112 [Staphylotrichum longicolle]|uniref:Extracellular membrane protein CFEM domain-containing protein n=1 Tax=Staphylotrichum longicolle TaxID=669026 RepID=A0AAD4EUY8_9PEZI|nr:hypothetical protein NEMBOFW57_007112 [Staphylotrichum longicolle]